MSIFDNDCDSILYGEQISPLTKLSTNHAYTFMLLNLQKTKYIILNYKHLLFILIHHASLCQYSVEIQSPEVNSGAPTTRVVVSAPTDILRSRKLCLPGWVRRDTRLRHATTSTQRVPGVARSSGFHFFFLMRLHLAFVILMNLLGSCNS